MALHNMFYFGGESSADYGITISAPAILAGAERAMTEQYIPGRSGALIIDNGYYKNVTVEYKNTWIKVPDMYSQAEYARLLKAWLLSQPGEYRELYDSYDGDYCRMGFYSGKIDIDAPARTVIQQDIKFSCKPYQYLRSSLRLRQLANGETLVNPHRFAAAPYIKITGSGDITLTVGNNSWLLSGVDGYIELDSERMNTYKGTQLLNDHKSGAGYPALAVGHTGIRWSGGTVQKVEIIPRWCTL